MQEDMDSLKGAYDLSMKSVEDVRRFAKDIPEIRQTIDKSLIRTSHLL